MFNRTISGFIFLGASLVFGILFFIASEFANEIIGAAIFLVVFKIIHNTTYKNESQKTKVKSYYFSKMLDKNGNPIANWLFRNSSYPYQFSLKCPDCTDILYTSTPSGTRVCKNNHKFSFHIHENLFSDNFELVNENTDYVQQIILETLFELLGHLSKSDGQVSEEEIDYTLYLMEKYIDIENDKEYLKALQTAFKKGKKIESYIENANLLKFLLRDDQAMRVRVIDILLEISAIDGSLDANEVNIIRNICSIFGDVGEKLLEEKIRKIRKNKTGPIENSAKSIENYFNTLESKMTDTLEVVKRNYFRLSKRYHPDQYINNNKEQEMANKKMQEINAAWELVQEYYNKQ